MNKTRAKEIINSADMINVTYNGIPVYIEDLNEGNGIAYIHPLNKPEEKEQVSITNLEEN